MLTVLFRSSTSTQSEEDRMAYIAPHPEHYLHKSVGTGQCVAYVQAAAHAPNTGHWHAGIRVKGANLGTIARGTVIATMVDGHYPNHSHGNHAAIYLSHDSSGIQVLDQWLGHPVNYRTIHWHGGHGNASNDGDAFYVVE
jgi:hypothetical protein